MLSRLDRLPLSRPHYLLLLNGGLGYTFDGMDVALSAFLLPTLHTVWSINGMQQGLIGSANQVGVLIGALLAGYLGDKFGRKTVMCWALGIYCVMTLIAAFSPNFICFIIARLLAGVGTGAESVIVAPYLSELIPPRNRGRFIGSLAGFFSFGFVGAAILGRFCVPEFEDGWRYAQVVTALPILMLLWWRRILPESPRFLLAKGRIEEAQAIVDMFEKKVVTATGQSLPPLKVQHRKELIDKSAMNYLPSASFFKSLLIMFSPEIRRQTIVIWVTWFLVMFCYYGFFNWIPSLLVARGFTVTRSFDFSIIICFAQIPGYFSAAFCSDWLDRKRTIALYMAGSAISAWYLGQAASDSTIVAMAAILSFCLNGVIAGLYAYTPEGFPTNIRATGCGFASVFGRIGSIVAPLLIGIFSASLGFNGVFTMNTLVLVAGIILLLTCGMNTRGLSLEELSSSRQRQNWKR